MTTPEVCNNSNYIPVNGALIITVIVDHNLIVHICCYLWLPI